MYFYINAIFILFFFRLHVFLIEWKMKTLLVLLLKILQQIYLESKRANKQKIWITITYRKTLNDNNLLTGAKIHTDREKNYENLKLF